MYIQAASHAQQLDFSNLNTDEIDDKFCDGDSCELKPIPKEAQTADQEELPFTPTPQAEARVKKFL